MLEPIRVVPVPKFSFSGRRLCIEVFPADDAQGMSEKIAEEVGAILAGVQQGTIDINSTKVEGPMRKQTESKVIQP